MVTATRKSKPKPGSFEVTSEQLDVETSEQMAKLRQGKSRAKVDEKVSAGNLLTGVEVIEEKDVPYSEIKRSSANPRTVFDEQLISEMAPTIETICRLNPLTIREGTNELIDGETRHRAGQVGNAKSLRCKIVKCTDSQAAVIRILTSLQRRDLNAIDRATGIKALQQQHGLSQRELEDVLKMKQGSISNLTRLLDLPDEWRKRVISGEITATAARELCPWVTEPEVMKSISEELFELPAEDRSTALTEVINRAVNEFSRPLKNSWYYDDNVHRSRIVDLKPTDEERQALRIRKVKIYRIDQDRCFNIELWEQLQTACEQKRAAKELKKLDSKGSKAESSDPKKAAENAKRQKEIFAKKLYRYRVRWFQKQLIYSAAEADGLASAKYLLIFGTLGGASQRGSDLTAILGYHGHEVDRWEKDCAKLLTMTAEEVAKVIRSTLQLWLDAKFEGWNPVLEPELIELLAQVAQIDLKRDWPKSCLEKDGDSLQEYLAILTREQLLELMAEWTMTPPAATAKRSEIVTLITDIFGARSRATPKLLIEAKAVKLV